MIIYCQQAMAQPCLYLESNSFPWVFLLFLESSFKNSSICSSKALRGHASRGWKLTPPCFLDQLDHGMGYLKSGLLGEVPDAWSLPLERPGAGSQSWLWNVGAAKR